MYAWACDRDTKEMKKKGIENCKMYFITYIFKCSICLFACVHGFNFYVTLFIYFKFCFNEKLISFCVDIGAIFYLVFDVRNVL